MDYWRLDVNRTYILFLVFTIFAFTACTGTEEQLQQRVEDEVLMPMEESKTVFVPPPVVAPPPSPPVATPPPVESPPPVVPPLVSDPPVEDPVVAPDPPSEEPIEDITYYLPGTVLVTLGGEHNSIQEGLNFTVRVDIAGVPEDVGEIVDGGCTVFMHDNHGHNTTKENERDRVILTTVHDDLDEENRTASVQILSDTCEFPQLDDREIRYEVDRNYGNHRVVVDITTAGPIDGYPDDGIYTLTMANLRVEGIRHHFDIVVDNPLPENTAVNFRWDWTIVYHDAPDTRPPVGGFWGLYRYVAGNWRYGNGGVWTVRDTSFGDDSTYEWFWDMYWWPTDLDKTLTVKITGFAKQPSLQPGGGYYTPPGGTYSVGEPRSMTVFVPAEVEQ